jgi:hypothetical protein
MGAFDSPNDVTGQIKHEGDTITLTFSPGVPNPGQGTVSWNIPAPMLGCASDSPGAYCGMVVLLSESALTTNHVPTDGVFYEGDPTADKDKHVGDAINGALVIGAYYEGEKKSRGEPLTTSFSVSDLKPKTTYYVIGYAVDCQGRYHKEGQRAYSDNYGRLTEPGTPSSQTVILNNNEGTLPTDGTGLVPGMIYEFEVEVNTNFPSRSTSRIVKVSEDGANLGTYQDLLDAINKQLALADSPLQSPVPPNEGRYFLSGTDVYQWDGTIYQPVNVLKEPTDPSVVVMGSYWHNPQTGELKRFNIPNPIGWNDINAVSYHKDPTSMFGGGDYWFDGTKAYGWCSTTWCEQQLYNQATDPTDSGVPDCSVYWFDQTENVLKTWNRDFERWDITYAIQWNTPPNVLNVGAYWYNLTTETLNEFDGTDFIDIPFIRSVTEPTSPNDDDLWFNPQNEHLSAWDDTTSQWIDVPVLVWTEDPRNTDSCDLWWDDVNDQLYLWDDVHTEWDQIVNFIQSPTDPYGAPQIQYGELWYNTSTKELLRWDGLQWKAVTFINHPTDPTIFSLGDVWHDTQNDTWYAWNTPSSGWNEINPIDVSSDPSIIPAGTKWYDTTNKVLYERQGSGWVTIPLSTQPLIPRDGDLWFDTTNDKLMQWVRNPTRDPKNLLTSQGSWEEAEPIAKAVLNDSGNLVLHTTGTGTNNMIMLLVPPGTNYGIVEGKATGDAGYDYLCCHYSDYTDISVPETSVGPDTFLFDYLVPPGQILRHQYGSDGVHELPTYEQIGVGDDGSPDERREIADWVRSQLGYPVVEVELTPKQINEAIDMAIETLRQRTSIAYQRSAFFLDIKPGNQHYKLTDRTCGFHKVVTIMAAYRFTSAFLSTAHGAGVYGQIVLQHLYNMGTFDLLSYHLVSQYVEQLEHLFATRLTFHWNESDRVLSFYQKFTVPERVLLDVTVERTEQSIMTDRWVRTWVKRYALMRGMEVLSNIRGKYASLPGAGGGVSLNAADLMSRATELREELNMEIDDYIANDNEDIGMEGSFILG